MPDEMIISSEDFRSVLERSAAEPFIPSYSYDKLTDTFRAKLRPGYCERERVDGRLTVLVDQDGELTGFVIKALSQVIEAARQEKGFKAIQGYAAGINLGYLLMFFVHTGQAADETASRYLDLSQAAMRQGILIPDPELVLAG